MNKIHCTIIGAVATFCFGFSVPAEQALLRPHVKSDPIRVVSGSSPNDIDLAHNIQYGNAKAREHQYSLRKVKGVDASVDLAHGPRPLMSGKDPRFDIARRELRESRFEIAPLK